MTQYDEIIISLVHRTFPQCPDWLWIKAQIWAESGFNPNAISSVGAQGLMQLMPGTAKEMGVIDPFDPYQNLQGGIKYMSIQYDHFPEIPDLIERYLFSLASYNCGRGYVNRAIKIARKNNEPWQTWKDVSKWLKFTGCIYKETINYVAKISRKYEEYRT